MPLTWRLVLALCTVPLALRLLGTYAILSGPWSLIAGVLGPLLGVLGFFAAGVALMRGGPRIGLGFLACLNLGLAVEDLRLNTKVSQQGLSVITWNTALGYSAKQRCVQKVLGREKAQIVALQELRQDDLENIAVALDMRCTWAGYFPIPGSNGLGLCVPKDWGIHLAQQRSYSKKTQYAYLFAELRPPQGKAFNVMNVHLQSPALSRQQSKRRGPSGVFAHTTARQIWQLFEMMRVASGLDDPLLLLGDFNSTPNTWAHGQLRERFSDGHRAAGQGLGSTRRLAGWLPVRIDYLYASKHLRWLDGTRSLDDGGCSDHRPVIGRFTYKD
jgi:endonuclease/exonuclease/phosphatase (EEP) superfamily protein YafD